MTRAELLGRLDAGELGLWREFYRVEPWGDEAADERLAVLRASVYQAAGAEIEAENCRINWGPPPEPVLIPFAEAALMLAARSRRG